MNDVVGGARMIGILLIDVERDRSCLHLSRVAFVARSHCSEKRKRIEACRFEILGRVAMEPLHGPRVGDITSELVALAVERLDRAQVCAFSGCEPRRVLYL